jgi:hypothetical protein
MTKEKSAEETLPSKEKSAGKAAPRAGTETEAETEGKAGTTAEGEAETEGKAGATAEGEAETEGKAGATAEGEAETEGKAGVTAEGEAETSGNEGTSVKLESEQVNEVKTFFTEHKPRVKAVEKSEVKVSIGIAIPTVIALYDLPPDVIVVSRACPIKYFVWGDDIVLVDSCTREVVEIIVGIA